MKKKRKKNKNINQISFYFEDYLETNKKNQVLKKSNNFQDRIYLLFFFFFSLILIFSIKITHISLNKKDIFNRTKIKTRIVNGEQLCFLATQLGMNLHLIISKHIEENCAGRDNQHILECGAW